MTNVILFITTRHSFIKQVANGCATRVRVTTQRITIREDSGPDCVELDDIKSDASGRSPNMSKSPYFASFEDAGNYMEGMEEKVSATGQYQDFEIDTAEGDTGVHVTVLAV